MSFFDFVAVALSIATCLVPAYLMRHQRPARVQDFFVSSQSTPLDVIGNSSIGYALRIAAIGPFFAWGATGDIWPAIVGSACFGLGLLLLYKLRRPVIEFVGDALAEDRSITVHAFIARQHGNDPKVRLLAASLTLFALFGLIVAEAVAVATMLKPALMGSTAPVYLSVLGMLTLMMLCAAVSGNSGAMSCAQLQLGMAYLGLVGSAAFLLYLQASTLAPMPSHGVLAIGFVAAWCVFILAYRRSKYVDTNLIRIAGSGRPSIGATILKKFQQILNPCISFFAVLVVVVAGMLVYSAGLSDVGRESVAALRAGTRVPAVGLFALILLPLLYPLVDVANWQRIAAIEKHIVAGNFEPGLRPRILRSFFRTYGTEGPLLWLLICMFGAIAVVATETPAGADVMAAFMAQLVSDQNEATAVILPLLVVSVCAIALSTMISMFSASLCTIRYDIVPWFWPELSPGAAQAADEAAAMRRVVIAGVALLAGVAASFLMTQAAFHISVANSTFLALLFALGSAQLSLLPLVLGPIVARMNGGSGSVDPSWALAIMGCGALSGAVAAAIYVATGQEAWLWAAVPVCLGTGLFVFAMARLWPAKP